MGVEESGGKAVGVEFSSDGNDFFNDEVTEWRSVLVGEKRGVVLVLVSFWILWRKRRRTSATLDMSETGGVRSMAICHRGINALYDERGVK